MVDPRINPGYRIGFNFNVLKGAFAVSVVALVFLAGCLDLNAPSGASAEQNELAVALATTTNYEAENAAISGAVKASDKTGYNGTGFVDYKNASGDYIEWTVNVAATGTHELRIRFANGGATTRTLKLEQKHSTASSYTSISGSVGFPATGSWTTWMTSTPKYNFTKTGSYKIKLTATGTSGPNVDRLTLYGPVSTTNTPPSITSQPGSKSVSVGGSATFGVTASGTAPLTYQWQRNGSNISGATSASYTRSNIQSSDNGSTYRCVVKNAYGTATSGSATLTVTTGSTTWSKANLTWFTSYPAPGSDECENYNGCEWEGMFAALPGKQTKEWVQAHNIVAVHEKDFTKYKLKTLRIKQGTRQIDAVVYDMCADSDCNGCCTRNAQENGLNFLLDMESYTKARFGSGEGIVEWTCINCN